MNTLPSSHNMAKGDPVQRWAVLVVVICMGLLILAVLLCLHWREEVVADLDGAVAHGGFVLRPVPQSVLDRSEQSVVQALEGYEPPPEAGGFLEVYHQLNLTEAMVGTEEMGGHLFQTAAVLNAEAGAQARELIGRLGEEEFRRLALYLAHRGLEELDLASRRRHGEDGEEMQRWVGAFLDQVARPSGFLGDGSVGVVDDQARAMVRALFLFRIQGFVQPRVAYSLLSLEEQIVFLTWKVERATLAGQASRLAALRTLAKLDPSYPAREARVLLGGVEVEAPAAEGP